MRRVSFACVCVCVIHVYFITLEKVLAGGGHTHRSVYTVLVREGEGRGRACGFKTYEIIVYISSTYPLHMYVLPILCV